MSAKVKAIYSKYGIESEGIIKKSGKLISNKGVTVTDAIIERLKGEWVEEDEEEFKVLFLLLSLYMILCPTQSKSLEEDLVPALTCVMEASEYDWSSLVLQKLIASVKCFAKRFDAVGYAGGCGGCSLFFAIYYLDRLKRKPVDWGVWPRVKVWTADQHHLTCREDRVCSKGDFGRLQSIPATYGDTNPLHGGDKEAPKQTLNDVPTKLFSAATKCRGRRSKHVNSE